MEKRILIVDDEEPIRKLFARTLTEKNRDILTAASGAEALELMRNTHFDLVFLDLNMPGMDGAETLLEIRKRDRHVPVYIVTGYGNAFYNKLKEIQEKDIQFEILNKPVEKERLRSVVSSALAGPVFLTAES